MVVALDDFKEEGRSVLHRLGEDLQQVAVVVVVDEDVERLEHGHVFDDAHLGQGQPLAQRLVVRGRHLEELHAAPP